MFVIAVFFATLAATLRWAGHLAVILALAFGIHAQLIDSIATAILALLALAAVTAMIQLLTRVLGNLADALAPTRLSGFRDSF